MKYIYWASVAPYKTYGTHVLDFTDIIKGNVGMTFFFNFTVEKYLFDFNGAMQRNTNDNMDFTDATQNNT
jgi:hypothetical protein